MCQPELVTAVLAHVSWRPTKRAPPRSLPPLPSTPASACNMAPRERSEEVYLWYTTVYEAIQEIPHGKVVSPTAAYIQHELTRGRTLQVTSYGHIAKLVGKRERTHHMT
jgi:hypothetical protein